MSEQLDLLEEFKLALRHVRSWKQNISPKQKLLLYALFKQAKNGNCMTNPPERSDAVKYAKWRSWDKLSGMTKEQSMREYIDVVATMDPMFGFRKKDASGVRDLEVPQELLALPSTKKRNPSALNLREADEEALSVLSGRNPFNGQIDGKDRLVLYERIRRFYQHYDASKINQGIGDIVEWAETYGLVAFDEQLFKKYGTNLTSFEIEQHINSSPTRKKDVTFEDQHPEVASLLKKLVVFFGKYDPDRLENDFDELIKFWRDHGEHALNSVLYDKYGADLDDELPNPSMLKSPKGSSPHIMRTTSLLSEEFSARMDDELKDVRMSELNQYEVEQGFLDLLTSYYARYDPEKILNGTVERILDWTQRHGVEALNKKLRQRYNESLDEFADAAAVLQDDIINFYTRVDKNKLIKGLDEIVTWGLRNGRSALNKKLRAKYGRDLEENDIVDDLQDLF